MLSTDHLDRHFSVSNTHRCDARLLLRAPVGHLGSVMASPGDGGCPFWKAPINRPEPPDRGYLREPKQRGASPSNAAAAAGDDDVAAPRAESGWGLRVAFRNARWYSRSLIIVIIDISLIIIIIGIILITATA
ncbi:uncharacterized protein LOC144100903 [Amblyomma americanum]